MLQTSVDTTKNFPAIIFVLTIHRLPRKMRCEFQGAGSVWIRKEFVHWKGHWSVYDLLGTTGPLRCSGSRRQSRPADVGHEATGEHAGGMAERRNQTSRVTELSSERSLRFRQHFFPTVSRPRTWHKSWPKSVRVPSPGLFFPTWCLC